jgi:hypothetical protein
LILDVHIFPKIWEIFCCNFFFFFFFHRAKFNGRPKLPGWPGERWRCPESGRAVAFIEGEGKEVSTGAVVSGRGGAV